MAERGCVILLILIAYRDGKYRKIPNGLVGGTVVLSILSELTCPELGYGIRLFGGISVSGILICLCLIRPGCFGGGDIKLVFACGLILGPWKNLEALFIAALAAGSYILILFAAGKIRKGQPIAFGPFLCLGAAIQLMIN